MVNGWLNQYRERPGYPYLQVDAGVAKMGLWRNTGIIGKKGDHLIGGLLRIIRQKKYKAEQAVLQDNGLTKEQAEEQSQLMEEAREMLRKWEAGDEETVSLWKKMNRWVYEGFDETYHQMGVSFDKIYYESETYLAGKRKY